MTSEPADIIECSIPAGMTVDEWRRSRPRTKARRRRRPARSAASARHLALVPQPVCDHFHDTTSRYDRETKLLTFLRVCHVCETETVVESVTYEPRFVKPEPDVVLRAA